MSKTSTFKILFSINAVFLAGYIVITLSENHIYAGWWLMIFFVLVAIGFRNYEILKGYAFTVISEPIPANEEVIKSINLTLTISLI